MAFKSSLAASNFSTSETGFPHGCTNTTKASTNLGARAKTRSLHINLRKFGISAEGPGSDFSTQVMWPSSHVRPLLKRETGRPARKSPVCHRSWEAQPEQGVLPGGTAVAGGSSCSIAHHCRPHCHCKAPQTLQPPRAPTSCWGTARHQCRKPRSAWKQVQAWSGSTLPSFSQGRFWTGRFSHHNPLRTFCTL